MPVLSGSASRICRYGTALLALLTPYSQELVELALDHLDHFDAIRSRDLRKPGRSHDTAHRLCSQAQRPARLSRRAAFAFLDAACTADDGRHCLYAAKPGPADVDYFNEKFRRALKAGLNG